MVKAFDRASGGIFPISMDHNEWLNGTEWEKSGHRCDGRSKVNCWAQLICWWLLPLETRSPNLSLKKKKKKRDKKKKERKKEREKSFLVTF